jgi:UDP-2,4-diacetamido-2,4,6-trideoxy-beta-L-altropyranose hydrolase
MQIIIRADSSLTIGSGHLMRCLTLANFLRATGSRIVFICRNFPGNVVNFVREQGFSVLMFELGKQDITWQEDARATAEMMAKLDFKPDWLIVDHYSLDACWENTLRPYIGRIMVIDDLANRRHDCDLLLDANYGQTSSRYRKLVLPATKLLLGPEYALLREEFSNVSNRVRNCGGVRHIQVFFGGSDPTGETSKVVDALANLKKRQFFYVEVIVGAANPLAEDVRQQCEMLKDFGFACQVSNMAERMMEADLAIGAGGSTLWERCYLGLPSIVISVAENQIEASKALAKVGAIDYLGFHATVDSARVGTAVEHLVANPHLLNKMSCQGQAIVPQIGTEKVVNEICLRMGQEMY